MKPAIQPANQSKQTGFTLLELVIVVAFAIVLVALPLLAATTRDRATVQQIQCADNIRQLTHDTALYIGDNGKAMPSSPPFGSSGSWFPNLMSYASSTNLLRCAACTKPPLVISPPAAVGNSEGSADQPYGKPWILPGSSALQEVYSGIGFNGWFFSDAGGDGRNFILPNGKSGLSGYFTSDSAVSKPSATPVFFDENWSDAWPVETDIPPYDLYLGDSLSSHGGHEMGRLTIVRHGSLRGFEAPRNLTGNPVLPGAVNMSFYDGHVELVKLEKLWTFYWYVGCTPLSSGHPPPN